MMNNKQARSSLYAIAAAYLLYLAYGLFQARYETATSMTPFMRWLFIILFAAVAVALGIFAVRLWRQGEKEKQTEQDDRDESAEADVSEETGAPESREEKQTDRDAPENEEEEEK